MCLDATVARARKPAALTWLLTLNNCACIVVFSSELGTYAQPNFVENVFGGTGRIGTETGLNRARSADSSEDFINPRQDDVSDYHDMGLVCAAVNRHYGTLRASQLEYALLGIASGLCVGSPPTRSRARH